MYFSLVDKSMIIMILSVSRRTDIPAFYFDWFLKRMEAGFLHVKNPMNPNQISRIPLDKEKIDCKEYEIYTF